MVDLPYLYKVPLLERADNQKCRAADLRKSIVGQAFLPAMASRNACPTRVGVGSSFLKSAKPGIGKCVAGAISRPLRRIHFTMGTDDGVMCINFPAAFSQIINQLFAGL